MFDMSFLNVARTSVEAFDVQADYTMSGRLGEVNWYALATYQPHMRSQVLPTALVVDSAGHNGGLLEWRGNAGFNWERGAVSVGWNAQYYHHYYTYFPGSNDTAIALSKLNQGDSHIPRQVYHDLILSYRFGAETAFARGLLGDSEVSFGIQNLFDKNPPTVAIPAINYGGGYSTYGDPRLRRYSIGLRKSFK